MIDPRAMHSANSGVYDRFSQAAETASVEYLKGRGHAQDEAKHKAWKAQVKAAKAKKSAAPSATSSPSPSAPSPSPASSTPSRPNVGQKVNTPASKPGGNFGPTGNYGAHSGGPNLAKYDVKPLFAGKGTNQPDVSKAAVSRNVPPTPNPWAGKATISVSPAPAARTSQNLPGENAGHAVMVGNQPHQEVRDRFGPEIHTPAASTASTPASQGWAARTGQSLVSKASSIEQKRNGSGRRAGFAGGSSSHLSS